MRVRLTRKLAERLDGIDVSERRVGDVLELPPREARLLVAEEWATMLEDRRNRSAGPPHHERRAQPDS